MSDESTRRLVDALVAYLDYCLGQPSGFPDVAAHAALERWRAGQEHKKDQIAEALEEWMRHPLVAVHPPGSLNPGIDACAAWHRARAAHLGVLKRDDPGVANLDVSAWASDHLAFARELEKLKT